MNAKHAYPLAAWWLSPVVNEGASSEGSTTTPSSACEGGWFGLAPAAIAVLRAAAKIEADPLEVMGWYHGTPIREFDLLTAENLVEVGRAQDVLTFLRRIGEHS